MMRGRILVVDDDPITRAVIAAQLGEAGHEVLEATDGGAGLDQIRDARPDAVLLDIEMPAVDGFSVLSTLASDDNSRDIPVIVLTGRESTADAVRALQLGAIDFLRKPVQPTELLARIATALRVADMAARLQRHRRELEDAIRTDALTGLANRRHTEEHVSMAVSAARRHHRALSLLLVDVDRLRRVNDSEGHAAGDAVLRTIAERVTRLLRGEDMVGRWGDEELLVVAPNTDLDGAWHLGERIRDAVAAAPIPVPSGRDVLVTVSVGCATSEGDDIDRHLLVVERAVESAKANGRNRVCADAGD